MLIAGARLLRAPLPRLGHLGNPFFLGTLGNGRKVDTLGSLGNAVSGCPKCLSKEKTGKENAQGRGEALGQIGHFGNLF